MYNKILNDINHTQNSAKLTFARAFESYFTMMFRERRSATFAIMQDDALDVEANMTTVGKINHKKYFERKKHKDEAEYLDQNKNK